MGVWSDCEKYKALPFRGFPAKPKIGYNSTFILELPLGYDCGSKFNNIQTLAVEINNKIGKKIFEASERRIEVLLDNDKVANLLFEKIRSL